MLDAGDSYRYEQDACAWTRLEWDEQDQKLTIHDRQGQYPGMPEKREFEWLIVKEREGVGVS